MTVAADCQQPSRLRHRAWVSVLVGIGLSAFLAYLAARRVHWSEALQTLHRVEYRYLVLAAFGAVAMHGLRAWRLTVLLRPVRQVRAWPAFCYTAVGFLAILAFPFRIGELARPLLLAEYEEVPFATGLATIAVERCLDGLAFAGLITLATPWLPLPEWAAPLGYLLGIGYLLLLGLFVGAWLFRESCVVIIARMGRRVSPTRGAAIGEAARRFLDGLAFLPDTAAFGEAVLLSAAIWLAGIGVNYASFFALGLMLPVVAAAALQILVTLGVLLPTAPGFVGNFHYFAMMAVGLYGVEQAPALAFAVLTHATILVVNVSLGIGCGMVLQRGLWARLWGFASAQDEKADARGGDLP